MRSFTPTMLTWWIQPFLLEKCVLLKDPWKFTSCEFPKIFITNVNLLKPRQCLSWTLFPNLRFQVIDVNQVIYFIFLDFTSTNQVNDVYETYVITLRQIQAKLFRIVNNQLFTNTCQIHEQKHKRYVVIKPFIYLSIKTFYYSFWWHERGIYVFTWCYGFVTCVLQRQYDKTFRQTQRTKE